MACAQAVRTDTAAGEVYRSRSVGAVVKSSLLMLLVVVLAGCSGSGVFAPVTSLSDRGVGGTYTIQPGDTLSSISRETGVSVERLIALNNISNPSLIRAGQRLRLNDGAPLTASAAPSGSMAAQRMDRGESEPVQQASAAPARVTPAADASKLGFVWPARGEIIQRFSAQNNGITIAGNVGEPVVSAGDGSVVFAGDAVRGFGNLVIVDHGGGIITAYAHNETLLVQKGDAVKKSQQIATLGQSATTSPRLHFEVRRNGTPVDPMRYLPAQQ